MTLLGFEAHRRRFAIEAHTDLFWGWHRGEGEWFLFLGPFSIVWERP